MPGQVKIKLGGSAAGHNGLKDIQAQLGSADFWRLRLGIGHPGVKAVAARGHTAGHSVYVVESKGQKLVLWGDLMHFAAVQFPQPQVTIAFDTDSKAAMAQRKKAFAQAAKEGYYIGAAHLPFPGLGHLRSEAKGYAFVPVDYTTVR